MTDEEAFQTPRPPLGHDALKRQLRMARFAMHKNAIHKYVVKMQHFGATEEQAKEEYRKTMENFDAILSLAADEPDRMVAIEEDMAKGFYLPEKVT